MNTSKTLRRSADDSGLRRPPSPPDAVLVFFQGDCGVFNQRQLYYQFLYCFYGAYSLFKLEPSFDNEGVLSKRLAGFMGLGKIRSCGVRKNG